VFGDGHIGEWPKGTIDAVVIAASMGGPRAVSRVVSALPAAFPCPVVVVQHHRAGGEDDYARMLAKHARVPVTIARDGAQPERGVNVVPPGRPASLTRGGAWELGPPTSAPADATMTAIARAFRDRSLCAVMTGRLHDGAAGAVAVKQAGGVVIVQDPASATATEMPTAALATGCVDHVLHGDLIGPAITALVMAAGMRELMATSPPHWARAGVAV
jgi:two-component system chemotaxis response regulator CheB